MSQIKIESVQHTNEFNSDVNSINFLKTNFVPKLFENVHILYC